MPPIKPRPRRRLIIALALYVVSSAVITAFVVMTAHERALAHLQLQLAQVADRKSDALSFWLAEAKSSLNLLAHLPEIKRMARDTESFVDNFEANPEKYTLQSQISTTFKNFVELNDKVRQLCLVLFNQQGASICVNTNHSDGVTETNKEDPSVKYHDYMKALDGLQEYQMGVLGLSLKRKDGVVDSSHSPQMRMGTIIYKPDGKIAALLIMVQDVSQLMENMKASTDETQTIRTFLTNGDGDYLVHPDGKRVFGFELGKRYLFKDDFESLSDYEIQSKHDSDLFPRSNVSIFTNRTVDMDDVLKQQLALYTLTPSSQLEDNMVKFGGFTMLTLLLLGGVFGLYIYQFRIKEHNEHEQARLKTIISLENRFRLAVDASPAAIIMVNEKGHIELANAKTEELFGYDRAALSGQSIEMLVPVSYRNHHSKFREGYMAKPVARLMGDGREILGLHKSGDEIPIQVELNPVETEDGLKVLATVVDLSEREKLINELQRSNEELNNFAYIASHDLKAPLRGIDQLAAWLSEDMADKVAIGDIEHLRLMRVRISRMERLLDDLLAYSRAGKVEGDPEQIDSAKLIRRVFDTTRSNKKFELDMVGEFPVFTTAKAPLELVFRNLFDNAIKHHDKQSGLITVTIRDNNGAFYWFDVSDDGPGIPGEYLERIFRMFQMLRSRDEMEGSGIGLPMIKKTVEAMGGEITVNSNIPRGTVFSFKWPKNIRTLKKRVIN